ncbi:MAG: dihydrolipoyl dehydrogenase [Bauldia sp.]
MAETAYDLIVVGAGPGGYVAAIRAAQLGLKTAIVEKSHLGGICLNWGCIPTKALLRTAEVYRHFVHAEDYGLKATGVTVDFPAVVKRSRAVAGQLSRGVDGLLKKNRVQVVWGTAKLTAPGRLTVTAVEAPAPRGAAGAGDYTAKHLILATGARPRVLPGLEPDGKRVWTYFDAMAPAAMPKSLLVVGSGAIGVEFASFYRTLGAEVTLVEVLPQILPVEDEEIAALARKRFEKQGIAIHTGAKVTALAKNDAGVSATIDLGDGKTLTVAAEVALSAVGVTGNIEGLGLEALGVKTDRGLIVADPLSRTNIPGLYAIGDVAGPPMLAHKAEHEGVVCVEAIAGLDPHPLDKPRIPGCTYSYPQIASVGLTEKKALAEGREVRIGRFPFIGNGKAIALGEPDGLIKTVFDQATGQLLGAHLVGAEVTELIQGFVLAMNLETTEDELIHSVFPHPTLSEAMHESVLSAFGRAIHI